MINVLCVGEEWAGSNASGLFNALSRNGCIVNIVNELRYVSVEAVQFESKFVNRAVRPLQIKDFNNSLITITNLFLPDLVLVYKGAFLKPSTIQYWKSRSIPVINFFPDVSFLAHGSYIPICIPLYDHIFTTKSFGASDLNKHFNFPQDRVSFLPHGFDPTVHRRIAIKTKNNLSCDASFIGNYSNHKLKYLANVKQIIPDIDLKIWGNTWLRYPKTNVLSNSIQRSGVIGDLYALAINSSKINIALLSEQVVGASSGDQITSRTFHIPGSGGFMLHQRTEEVQQYFTEGREMDCFSDPQELASKISYYLSHENERLKISEAGYKRAQGEYSLDVRAKELLGILTRNNIISVED